MKVLVTGGTGFIGRYLIPMLFAQGHEVALLVREAYGMGEPLPVHLQPLREQLQLVFADLRNLRLTSRAVKEARPDAVVHLAAAGATSPFLPVEQAMRHNVNGTINLLRASCEKLPMQRVVIARTPGEQTSMNPYAASKAAAWNFCQMYARTQEWPIVGAMIFQSYGWGQPRHALIPSAFAAAMAHEDFAMTGGQQKRDWIHVEDVARGIVACISAEIPSGDSAELGSGTPLSVLEIVEAIYRTCNSRGKPLVGALAGRPGEAALQIADIAKRPPHWIPTLSLEEGLQRYVANCPETVAAG